MIIIDCNEKQPANWEESGANIKYVWQIFNCISLGQNKCNGLVMYKINSEEISDTRKGVCTPNSVDK